MPTPDLTAVSIEGCAVLKPLWLPANAADVAKTVIAAARAVQARIVRPLMLPPGGRWSSRSNRSRRPRFYAPSGQHGVEDGRRVTDASCGPPAVF